MRRLVITAAARRDIQQALWTSEDRHGDAAARRYRTLIELAIEEIRQSPDRPTSKSAQVADLRLFPLKLSARRLPANQVVRTAPHVLVYRFDVGSVEVVRLLHAAMDLPRHLAADGD